MMEPREDMKEEKNKLWAKEEDNGIDENEKREWRITLGMIHYGIEKN